MNGMHADPSRSTSPVPRVREQARDAFAVMAFSVCASGAVALVFLLMLVMGE